MNSNRRQFLTRAGLAGLTAAFFKVPGAFAQALVVTPAQTEGPYYPVTLPLDTDNDLLVINDAITPAVGEITYLNGRVLDLNGNPIRDARVEIWQADNTGSYIHPSSNGYANRDRNFQGFGRFLTGSTGEYLFRTIKPGLYPGPTRHIHMKVKIAGRQDLTTQVYVQGESLNTNDGVLQEIRDAQARASVVVPFTALEGSPVGALSARFDVVLGVTAASAPALTISNSTNATRNPTFQASDNWRLNLSGASPSTRVFLHLWKNGADLGISGPYGSLTDAAGAWSMTGSFGSSDAGTWQLQAVVGMPTSQEISGRLTITIT